MPNGPVEPNATNRAMAATLRELYLALIQEGFEKDEALTILGKMLEAGARPQ